MILITSFVPSRGEEKIFKCCRGWALSVRKKAEKKHAHAQSSPHQWQYFRETFPSVEENPEADPEFLQKRFFGKKLGFGEVPGVEGLTHPPPNNSVFSCIFKTQDGISVNHALQNLSRSFPQKKGIHGCFQKRVLLSKTWDVGRSEHFCANLCGICEGKNPTQICFVLPGMRFDCCLGGPLRHPGLNVRRALFTSWLGAGLFQPKMFFLTKERVSLPNGMVDERKTRP